jgi:cytochrome d ubiquinol oxidase subunit II
MELQITWFVLWAVLWAVYFMLDGFVLGTGMLYFFLGKNEKERLVLLNSIGPVWNGNEVWLLTAGGATFAAFPTTYALMFSYLYTALLLLLFSLIIRGVSIEFHGKGEGNRWRGAWNIGILLGSFLPALLFGVAFGNIFQGLPMDAAGYHGSLLGLLNPYGLLTGIVFVVLFLVHGALYISLKSTGVIADRALKAVNTIWYIELGGAVAFLLYTYFATKLYDNFFAQPLLLAVPLVAVAALLGIKFFAVKEAMFKAFLSSCVTILFVVFTGVIGLYPNLIPSSIDKNYSLTIFNTSSSQATLMVMTVAALIFVPIVIAYKIWVYRLFSARISTDSVVNEPLDY